MEREGTGGGALGVGHLGGLALPHLGHLLCRPPFRCHRLFEPRERVSERERDTHTHGSLSLTHTYWTGLHGDSLAQGEGREWMRGVEEKGVEDARGERGKGGEDVEEGEGERMRENERE
eukprot:845092-Rhodomonas_salina.1